MKNLLLLSLLSTVLTISGFSQNRPLFTETAKTVEKNSVRLELGFAYFREVKYTATGLEGNLLQLGDIGARIGVGEKVEIQMAWTVQNFLNVTRRWDAPLSERIEFTGNSTHDVGDLLIATKVNFLEENDSRPGLGLRFGTQLPNASQESGLGVDETNFFVAVLLEKKIGEIQLIGNLGLSILGDPTNVAAQNDLYNFSFATIVPILTRVNLFADLCGRAGTAGIGTEEQTRFRTGGQIRAAGINWDFGFLFGFRDTDPKYGFMVGLTKDFSF